MEVKAFYDAATYTLTYVVWDERTRDAIVIDPVLDYEPVGSQTSTTSVDEASATRAFAAASEQPSSRAGEQASRTVLRPFQHVQHALAFLLNTAKTLGRYATCTPVHRGN